MKNNVIALIYGGGKVMRVWYLTFFVLMCLQVAMSTCLLFWVYRSTKSWGLAFNVAGNLEWPIKDMELKSKLSQGQIILLKIAALMRSLILISIPVIVAVILAIKIWRY